VRGGVAGGLELSVRTLALPWMLGLRWAGSLGAGDRSGMPRAKHSLALALKVAADELFFATELASGALALRRADRHRQLRELEEAHAILERRGWLADPARYHRTPPAPTAPVARAARVGRRHYLHLRFESGFAPCDELPGRARWERNAANRDAHAWLLRHPGPPRPWVVCVPGFRMGHPAVDFTGFRARWLHDELGLNVAIAVLPLHGPRRAGRRSGDGYLSGNFIDTLHAQTQAVWDVRRLLAWLRREGAPAIGVHGVSLGAYTAAVVAGLEDELDAVVAGIPASSFVGLARRHVPPGVASLMEHFGFPLARIDAVMRVVSPLALPARVPRERRFLYAATADRLAPPEQAWDLWRHWERPRIAWYHGSHVSFLVEPAVRELLREALSFAPAAESGASRRAASGRRIRAVPMRRAPAHLAPAEAPRA
jgi:hypothetical protein